ncbi:MAG: DUF134 domain-containing protein [Syntrophorhabdaceae bacterium]|nr:DUF134 domain-containing protein [Syntrophorhabdaceae bacterium]
MSRPKKCRCVCCKLESDYFKPRGMPLADLDEVDLKMDELEALRLADFEGLYQEEAARQMNISRATFGRIVEAAHRKVADAILHGKALRIQSQEETAGGTI